MAARNTASSEKRKSAQSFKTACRSTTRAPYLTPRRALTRSSLERWLDGNAAVPTSALRSDSPLWSPAEVRTSCGCQSAGGEMLTQLGRPTSASGSAIAAGHHCEATSWQRKVPAMIGNGVRSRRWEKPAYAGAESKPSNSARARNACECHRIRCPAGTAQQRSAATSRSRRMCRRR